MKVEDRIYRFKKKYNCDPQPENLCPCFEKCNINKCPLSKNFDKLENTSGDKFKCKCPKVIRNQIGKHFKLKNQGLKQREISGKKNWENLSPEEKERRTHKLKEISPLVRLKSKGYGIVRVGKDKSLFTQATELKTPYNSTKIPFTDDSKQNTLIKEPGVNTLPSGLTSLNKIGEEQ